MVFAGNCIWPFPAVIRKVWLAEKKAKACVNYNDIKFEHWILKPGLLSRPFSKHVCGLYTASQCEPDCILPVVSCPKPDAVGLVAVERSESDLLPMCDTVLLHLHS